MVEINNDSFINNSASVHASAIYSKDSLLLINNSSFIDNSVSSGAGGAIYSDNSTMFILNSLLHNNSASIGGAITQCGSNDLSIKNTEFTDNHADKCGGAIYTINSPIILINNTLTGNTANNASSICILSSPLGSIKENNFNNNQIDSSSVYIFESNLLIEHNRFIQDNIILNDMGLYSIENNYWNSNQPNFHIRTNNITPNSITTINVTNDYQIYLTAPSITTNNKTIIINMSVYNLLNESITDGSIKLEINDVEESIIECINNTFTYNITIPEDAVYSMKIKATYYNSENIDTGLNIFKNIKITSHEDIYFVSIPPRAKPNEKMQFVVKILENEDIFINNRKVEHILIIVL